MRDCPLIVRSVHIRPLTTLRFLAALYVVYFHTLPARYRPFADYSVLLGYSSVSFFFILSGFVLALAYEKRLADLDRKEFWRARFARIYPLFLLTVCLDLPNLLFARIARSGLFPAIARTAATLLGTIFMLQAWWPQRLEGLDNPNWSLSVEAVFYLLFPVVARFIWRRTITHTSMLLLVSYACGIGLVLLGMKAHLPDETLFYLPVLHIAEFVNGILIARLFLWAIADERKLAFIRKSTSLVLCWAALTFYCLIRWPGLIPKPILHDGGLFLLFGPVILVFASGEPRIEALFSHKWLVLLGESSYGLYLIHMVLWNYVGQLVTGRNLALKYAVYVLAAVALSVLTYRLFEQPARRWLIGRSKARVFENPPLSDLVQ